VTRQVRGHLIDDIRPYLIVYDLPRPLFSNPCTAVTDLITEPLLRIQSLLRSVHHRTQGCNFNCGVTDIVLRLLVLLNQAFNTRLAPARFYQELIQKELK